MDANTGRHPIISTPSTLRQNRTDRVDTRALRDGHKAPERIPEAHPGVPPQPAPTAHRAEERTDKEVPGARAAAETWLQTVSLSASLLGEDEGGPSASDLESAILAVAARATTLDSHADDAPSLPASSVSPPALVLESSARVPDDVPSAPPPSRSTGETVSASELDELVLDTMLGETTPEEKLDTSAATVDATMVAAIAPDAVDTMPLEVIVTTTATQATPLVTIVMPAYNEENFIEACIASVQAQDYPRDRIEILVADGRSSDKTREIVARLAADDSRIRIIDNPARLQAAGLGLAVKEARGDVIVRMDVHAEYAPDYVRQCVATLEKTGAQNVGGAQRARAKSLFQKALCVALGSKLGTGGAGYRHEDAEGFVDTVFLGAFRRKVFETVGLWDPKAITNEDSELNQRILENGGTIYLSKDIVVHYYPRESLKALATQYFRYGRGRARTLLKMGRVPTIRPFLPFLAMTGLAATAVLPPLWPLAPLAFGAYALATGAEAFRIGRGLGAKGIATVWSIFPTLHASHAAGVWAGLVRYLRDKDWTDEPEVVAPVSTQTELAF